MLFNLKKTDNKSHSSSNRLGNGIHEVWLQSVEKLNGNRKEGGTWSALRLTFENENGSEPWQLFIPSTEDDTKRRKSTTKAGKEIEQASNVEAFMLTIRHILDAINPEVSKKILDSKEPVEFKSEDDLISKFQKWCAAPIKNKTKVSIKILPNDNKNLNYSGFPRYIASVNKEGDAYISNNVIGDKLFFSAYELDLIKKQKEALNHGMGKNDGSAVAGVVEDDNTPNSSMNAPEEADDLPF